MRNRIKAGMANMFFKFISVEEKLCYMFLGTKLNKVRPIVIVPAVDTCTKAVVNKLKKKVKHGHIVNGILNDVEVSVIQTQMGSPAVAVIMEILKYCACKAVIRIDFCGGLKTVLMKEQAIDTGIKVGSIIIPKSVVLSDGTSFQYLQKYAKEISVNSIFHSFSVDSRERWIYPNIDGKYWAVACDESLHALYQEIIPESEKRAQEDRLWSSDALFCEDIDAINTWRLHGCNSVDMESCVIYILGALFAIPVISILAVSNLTILEEDSFLKTKKINPNTLQGLDDVVALLCKSLPLIQRDSERKY